MKIVFLLLIVCANSSIARSSTFVSCYDNSRYFKCSKSDDCMIVDGICGESKAVNRKVSKEAIDCFRIEGASTSCPVPSPQKVKAACSNGTCSVETLEEKAYAPEAAQKK